MIASNAGWRTERSAESGVLVLVDPSDPETGVGGVTGAPGTVIGGLATGPSSAGNTAVMTVLACGLDGRVGGGE